MAVARSGLRRAVRGAERHLQQQRHSHSHALASSSLPEERFRRYNNGTVFGADYSAVLRSPQTRVTALASGVRVASESRLGMGTATVGVWIDAGSRFESASTNGAAHFLEHMMFKGTKRRSQRQLEEEVENMGAHLNAFTSREHTAYFARVLNCDVPAAVDILADILQNSAFSPSKIERERDVILRELFEVECQMQEVLFDRLHAAAFQYCSLGRTILGPFENIETLSRANLRNYVATHYTGPRMVVAAAGGVRHDDLVALAEKSFCSISNSSISAAEYVKDSPACFTGSEVRILSDELPLAYVAVAFEGASSTDPDSIALMIMQTMLGTWSKYDLANNQGSELAQSVEANNLAESFMGFNTNYRDSGLFGIYAIAKPDKLDDLSACMMRGLTRLAHKVSPADVFRAQNQMKSSLLRSLDGTAAIFEDIGRQLLTYGRRIPLAEYFARIDAVDAAAVQRVANRFINDKDIVVAALGPVKNLPDHDWFRERNCWSRV